MRVTLSHLIPCVCGCVHTCERGLSSLMVLLCLQHVWCRGVSLPKAVCSRWKSCAHGQSGCVHRAQGVRVLSCAAHACADMRTDPFLALPSLALLLRCAVFDTFVHRVMQPHSNTPSQLNRCWHHASNMCSDFICLPSIHPGSRLLSDASPGFYLFDPCSKLAPSLTCACA